MCKIFIDKLIMLITPYYKLSHVRVQLYLPQQHQHGDITDNGFGSDEVASWVSEGMPPTTSSVASIFAGTSDSMMSFR